MDPFGVYIHWPFCKSKCPYCDFNSHAGADVDQVRWMACYLWELGRHYERTEGRKVSSVFFGGGTPSLMDPRTVAEIVERIDEYWGFTDDVEITLEANPSSTEAASFAAYKSVGVNRLSLGIQSFDDRQLRFLGRAHNAFEATAAIDLAAKTFPRFSFDLIYARPEQTEKDWQEELHRALSFHPKHLSAYQLTIEQGTAFHKSGVPEMDEDHALFLYDLTQAVLEDAGLPAYEVSNHAAFGEECRHNLLYWQGHDYVGIGPGAHGRLTAKGTTEAIHQVPKPESWLAQIERDASGDVSRTPLSPEERSEELLLMGLRLTEGIDIARFERLCGRPLADVLDQDGLARTIEGGFVKMDPTTLRATEKGRHILNAVLAEIVAAT